ncbi:c-type cytochrome [Niveispirillum sp. KHB5.9]|uniref:cytochrome c oxidase subunit II n=1 Tax=Niveispirillum sp. KHB5.9 TaxID=3400269 RepID=UPI003A8ADC8C
MRGRWAFLLLPLAGCGGVQSALSPTGAEAREIGLLFWISAGLAIFVTLLVGVLLLLSLYGSASVRERIASQRVIVAGGIVFPTVALSLLLFYGLVVMQAGISRSAGADGPTVTIIGKQWWWHVVYELPDGRCVASANELRLPVGRRVALRLETDDVIHSFWAPQLGGKLDMIPGRSNVLTIQADRTGISRAQCAEYCGGAHALMSMHVAAMEAADYDAWLMAEAAPARPSQGADALKGKRLFFENGCDACHTVRGTDAAGLAGPDLTHVGSRHSLAAATLPNDREALARWLVDNQHIKPGNFMPEYPMLDPPSLAALAAYLDGLE